jgi:surface antigen
VRHYVRFDEISDTAAVERLVELVAIRPGAQDWPPIARAALDRAVQQALDELPDGEARPWSSSGVETQVTIQPTSRFESADGKPCRTFLLSWSGSGDGAGGEPGGQRRYPGAACRNALGAWEIPGLEGDPDSNLAISQNMAF